MPVSDNCLYQHPAKRCIYNKGIQQHNAENIQIYQGIIIAKKHGKDISSTITVRKVVDGIGVERVFPIHSPSIEKIEIVGSGKVRRSKLYYLREAKGKKSRLKKRGVAAAVVEEVVKETIESPAEEKNKEEK